jgi:phosphoglycolate phosphatase
VCEKKGKRRVATYENIVWDWNGTLLDDLAISVETLNKMLKARALPGITPVHYRKYFDFPVRPYYKTLGFDLSREKWHDISEEYIKTYETLAAGLSLTVGARDVLNALSRAGMRQYVLSALREDLLKKMLEHFEIGHYFAAACGSDTIHADGKLARGRRMLDDHFIPPINTLMIGDTLHDADVASALGFDILLYTGGHNSASRLRPHAPIIQQLSLILDHLR